MADTSKAHKLKLANSRKKFKELQELKRKKAGDQSGSAIQTPADNSLTSSTHSSINGQTAESHINSQLTNYFDNALRDGASFFDNLSQTDRETSECAEETKTDTIQQICPNSPQTQLMENIVSDIIVTPQIETSNFQYGQNYSLFSKENQPTYLAETQHIIRPNQDDYEQETTQIIQSNQSEMNYTQETQEISQPDMNYVHRTQPDQSDVNYTAETQLETRQNEVDISVDYDDIKQNEIYDLHNQNKNYDAFSPENMQNLSNYLPETQFLNMGTSTADEIKITSDNAQIEVQHSSIESLQQLSSQMAEMIEPEYSQFSSSITDLEKRNLELAALLEQERLKCEQQTNLISDLQIRISKLETENQKKDEENNVNASSELAKLKDELQCHIQTVGLLVAEKTELSSNLSQFELNFKQKNSECEELQTRLKASRSRVAELEREINILKSERLRNEHLEQEKFGRIAILEKEYEKLKEQKEELFQDLLEVREKLKHNSEENLLLQQRNQELASKLSLAEIKIQQIASGNHNMNNGQVEQLTQEKFELEKQISSLSLSLTNITKEKEDSSSQYQQYSQQLNAQITNLSNHIEQLQNEIEILSARDQSRIKHISELERQLQNLQNEQINFAVSKPNGDSNVKAELDNLRETCVQLQMEKTMIEENLTKTINEKEMLLKELEAKNDSMSQLETMVEQLRGNQPDSVKLLATMESDKIAAARAVQQNKELKEQMESMQEVFMKLDQDKVDLTEKLNREQISSRELLEKLQKVELQLQRLTDAIEIKDRELSHLRDSSMEAHRLALQQEQLTDRLMHYEARDNSVASLQNELQEAKQTIIKLTNEMNLLKDHKRENGNFDHKVEEQTPNLNNSADKTDLNQNERDTNDVNKLDKEIAMKRLEEKFNKTMQDIAELTEEKQRLEHLVLQLQGETETIGEYVALYQQQRMVLKQRAMEKDQQLKQLANDKEEIKGKLDKLNELIKKLVSEKADVPKQLLAHHISLQNEDKKHSNTEEEIVKTSPTENVTNNSETAEEIMELLSEIKQSNLVQSNESIHHCAWCSGQLITV